MWMQGDHVCLTGSTGTGKTELLERLAASRKYVIVFQVKSDTLAWRRFQTIHRASQMDLVRATDDGGVRLLLSCAPENRASEFRKAIKKAYSQGGWTLCFDELWEMSNLGLDDAIIQIYSEGRTERVTCVGGTQRPSYISNKGVLRWAMSQPTHHFCFQTRDERDIAKLAEIFGRRFAHSLLAVPRFKALYLNNVTKVTQLVDVRNWQEVFE